MEILRDFMPGECSLGQAAEAFEAVDTAKQASPDIEQKIAIAKLACQSCAQLLKCQEQVNGIKDVLSARAPGAQFVIGGEVVERVEPVEPDPALNEPKFVFDLSCVPDDPRQLLVIARQAFNSGQLTTLGVDSKYHPTVTAHLRSRLKEDVLGSEEERDALSAMAARMALKYLSAQRHKLSRRKAAVAPTIIDLQRAEKLQAAFAEDVTALDNMGAIGSLAIAVVHDPMFFDRVMHVYGRGYDLTEGRVRDIFRASPQNALEKIQELAAVRQQVKKAASNEQADEQDLACLNEGGMVVARSKEKKRLPVIRANTWRNPALKDYITRITKMNITTEEAAKKIRILADGLKELQRLYPDIDDVVLAHITYHQSDLESRKEAIDEYRTAIEQVRLRYESHPEYHEPRLRRFAYEIKDTEQREVAINTYLAKIVKIRATDLGGEVKLGNDFVHQLASYYQQEITEVNVAYEFKKYHLRQTKRYRRLDTWICDKVARLYDTEACKLVAEHALTFIGRGYLKVVFTVQRVPGSSNHIGPKGQYLTWNNDFLTFTPEEREAILAASKLDQLVLGKAIDEERLKAHFKTNDLRQYVDAYLLPHTLTEEIDEKNGTDILNMLRRQIKDNPKRRALSKVDKGIVEVALQEVLTWLQHEDIDDHNINSRECINNLRLLLTQLVFKWPSKLKRKQLVRDVVHTYLGEVTRIKAHQLEDAYAIGRGYSADFCDYFMTCVNEIKLTKSKASGLIRLPSMQAMLELRKFQQVLQEFKPAFEQRKITAGYLTSIAFSRRGKPQRINDALNEYDEAIRVYEPNLAVDLTSIRSFCFVNGFDNVVEEIQDWLQSMDNLPARFHHIDRSYIKPIARTRRGRKLEETLEVYENQIDEIMGEYDEKPHPSIDRMVVEFAVFSKASPKSWLNDRYIKGWEKAHLMTDISDIAPNVLRRIIMLHVDAPLNAIAIYKRIRSDYEGDKYIQPYMIDEAIKWNLKGAASYLKKTRLRLKERYPSLSAQLPRSEKPHDATRPSNEASPEDIVVDTLSMKDRLLLLLADSSAVEKAVIAEVYGFPWLAPKDMLDEDGNIDALRLMAHYGVNDLGDLSLIAEQILAKLKTGTNLH